MNEENIIFHIVEALKKLEYITNYGWVTSAYMGVPGQSVGMDRHNAEEAVKELGYALRELPNSKPCEECHGLGYMPEHMYYMETMKKHIKIKETFCVHCLGTGVYIEGIVQKVKGE
jgi:DnaJ-class molecular chaperone